MPSLFMSSQINKVNQTDDFIIWLANVHATVNNPLKIDEQKKY